MEYHSKLGASKAHQWVPAPGLIVLEEYAKKHKLITPQPSTEAAEEGTALHYLADLCLRSGKNAKDFIGETLEFDDHGKEKTLILSEEQAEAVDSCLTPIRKTPGYLMTEQQVDYGKELGLEEGVAWGTTDVVIIDGDAMTVIDFKFGRKFVEQHDNYQMLLYAIGSLSLAEIAGDRVNSITLKIMQPRAPYNTPEGWTISREELEERIEFFSKAVARVDEARQAFTDLDNLGWAKKYLVTDEEVNRWSPVASINPLLKEEMLNMFDVMDDDRALYELDDLISKTASVKLFIESLEKEAKSRLLNGTPVKGYKLIEGRMGNRKWKDEKEVIKEVTNLGFNPFGEPKIQSPAQLERRIKDVDFSKYVTRSPAKPIMVTADTDGVLWADEIEFDIIGN